MMSSVDAGDESDRPVVLVTGASGWIGSALTRALQQRYRAVALDRRPGEEAEASFVFDLGSDDSVELALRKVRDRFGMRIASVVHLAAYFDFTGKESPLYDKVNVEGTARLLRFLRELELEVEQFVYSGTMLVHEACRPGESIDETAPIRPGWAYPRSKARAEEVIRAERGDVPAVFLRIAGIYDDKTVVPTLAHQIARVYERNLKSHLYSGDLAVGQSMVHRDDLVDAIVRTIDRRHELPRDEIAILIGEPEAPSYGALQDRLGCLIHGERAWRTRVLPKTIAATGAWVQEKMEPVIPDAIDQGEKPFIRPFMVRMADDHYALDITRARTLLGWKPAHRIEEELAHIVAALKRDPVAWYRANKVTLPPWLESAALAQQNPEELRSGYWARRRAEQAEWRWAHFVNVALGAWLMASPPTLGYGGVHAWNDMLCGLVIAVLGLFALSWRYSLARWLTGAVGVWLLFAPLVFWTPSAAAYLNDTLVGALVFGFALLTRPEPGVSPVAGETGPTIPPGWDFSPSDWTQRLPVIALAFIGLFISRHLAAYQLGHIEAAWDPFFQGVRTARNGTEEIITSAVAEAWPVSDAGLGAVVYLLEILVGISGSRARWRTSPWNVALFGLLVVPLGIVSITFIVIQPIILGTWCTLCLIGAGAMLAQIPYALDEIVAMAQFLKRRREAGQPLFLVFFVGDTDVGDRVESEYDPFGRRPGEILREALTSGVSLPWNLAICIAIGIWLMFTRVTLGTEGGMANADHLIGALLITVTVPALAEVARPVRLLNIPLGLALLVTPFALDATALQTIASLITGIAVITLSLLRGPIRSRYGAW